ncbi:MAG: sulfurtransferase complex subunit TusB [Azonexus sp.]|jgi:tRNA 2-thiouridine synthesizing protein B|nr:sulfurtransferase complex subunit TusB [Azonexus sp.]
MLHIINKSPLDRPSLDSVLRLAGSGAVLLIEDAVYAATEGHAAADQVRALAAKMKVFALTPDLEARGIADRVIEGVAGVDYGGFVDLVSEYPNCQSWL